ncbi:GAF domain-containing protein [Rhodococcus sp. T7]|uniref:GAF domain-containing protein n=1 Tax=Rhodococcus sp. T7 TaxID=627444 RepID=UPI0013579327|nr:GAF domain-containing protein [Rhodococcus sp. T7]KAF0965132.1 hypothetical protein MLGJGCBP_01707 [Rhodococcus sp. T7]
MTETLENEVGQATTSKQTDWLVIETLGLDVGADPTVVAEGGDEKEFHSLRNRKWRIARSRNEGFDLARIARESVEQVVATRKVLHKPHTIANKEKGSLEVGVVAHPVLSARGEVFGVQLWMGEQGSTIPALRSVGSFEWDAQTQLTEHGPNVEEILGFGAGVEQRAVQDVWGNLLELVHRYAEYADYVGGFCQGAVAPGLPFASEVSVNYGGDPNNRRLTYMTTRTREDSRGKRVVGLFHDITSEVKQPKQNQDRETLRAVAAANPDAGTCRLLLASGLFLDWYSTPPGDLARWKVEVPEFHEKSQKELDATLVGLRDGTISSAKMALFMRFSGDSTWVPADVTITPLGGAQPGEISHGVALVRPGTGPLCW